MTASAKLPRACVIGAGPSGLTAAKALKERGIPFDCFEMSDDVGGVWYFENPNGRSSAYESLHINTSKSVMAISDFPMPEHYPNYTNHQEIHAYFRDYAEHFGVLEGITFNTEVTRAARTPEGVWRIGLSSGETREYDALFVCNGHHWDPQWPDPPFPGAFHGQVMHSHYYRRVQELAGKRVVLVGIGNSAMDIAVEGSYVAERVYLSARRGAHIIPKYLMGRPTDLWVSPWLPFRAGRFFFSLLLRSQVGRPERFGLPKPDHKLMHAHPTISSTILDRIAHGEVIPKPNIAALEGDCIRFVDGTAVEADLLIYCTGYKVSFPFFEPGFLPLQDNDLPLYLRMIRPEWNNLFFIGLFQPLGAIFPLAEQQAVLAAEYLMGRAALPDAETMFKTMERERAVMRRRYVHSKRHTMQVDFHPFMRQLRRALRQGARRAARQGNALPVPARAAAPESSPAEIAT